MYEQYRAALLKAPVFIVVADRTVSARFVHSGIERELSTALGRLARRNNAPAGDHLGEVRNVVLRIARSDSSVCNSESHAQGFH